MICVRCDQGIRPDEPYDSHHHDSASLAGRINHSHQLCPQDIAPGTGTRRPGITPAVRNLRDR